MFEKGRSEKKKSDLNKSRETGKKNIFREREEEPHWERYFISSKKRR